MKKLLLLLGFIVATNSLSFAQNAVAKILYEQAEEAFENKDYKTSIQKLDEAKQKLNSTNPKLLYLRIMAQKNMMNDQSFSYEMLEELKNDAKYYIDKFENSNAEKYKGVYVVYNKLMTDYPNREAFEVNGPGVFEKLRSAAEKYKSDKNYKEAAVWYEKLTARNSDIPQDYFWAGSMYYFSKDYTNAAKAFALFRSKFPDQPTAIYWQGRTAAAVDEDAKTGAAASYFSEWFAMSGDKNTKDLIIAFEYMLMYYYNSKDKEKTTMYRNLLLQMDANNSLANTIR